MKLLIYSHFFPPSIGGVETIVESLAGGLAVLRNPDGTPSFDITVTTMIPAGKLDDTTFPFRVVRVPSALRLFGLIREADVIHIAGPSLMPLCWAWLLRKPVVLEHHGYQAICPNGVLIHQPDQKICPGYFQAGRYEKCWRCQHTQLSVSRSLLSLFLMFPRNWLAARVARNLAITRHVLERHKLPRMQVINYGIDHSIGSEESTLFAAPGPRGLCFAFVGRFVPEKGVPVLLEAVRRLDQEGFAFEVRLIGDGPERGKFERIINTEQLQEHVRITGYLSGTPLLAALKDVGVVVMPSVWEETAGLAAIEQMMRGRLVIASAIGGLREVVDNAGMIFPPGDSAALAECMKKVIREPSLIDILGQQARQRAVDQYGRRRMLEEHVRVYHDILSADAANHSS